MTHEQPYPTNVLTRRKYWGLSSVLVGLIAAALRWPGLANFPFEQDEVYTLQEARELFATTLRPGIDARPAYYLLYHWVTPILPPGEYGARLLPFLFGLLGLLVTWRLGKFLADGPGGFLGVTICAFSPWHVFVSGEARYWSLVYLLAAASILLLLRSREENTWETNIAAGCVIAAGALSHPTFIFPIVGIALASLFEFGETGLRLVWPRRRALLGTWLLSTTLIFGYHIALRLLGRGNGLSNWSGRGWQATFALVPAMMQLASLTLVTACVIGVISALAWGTIRAKYAGLFTLLGLGAGTFLLLVASTRTDVYADYGVALLPLLIVGAVGTINLSPQSRRGTFALGTAAILVAGMLPEFISQLSDGMRFDYRPAFAHIQADSSNAPAVVWPIAIQRYYAPQIRGIEFAGGAGQLDSLALARTPFWVVASESRDGLVGQSAPATQSWLDKHCVRKQTNGRRRFDYRIYRVILYFCTADQRGS